MIIIRISYQPFVVATSRLNEAAEKNLVISNIRKLGMIIQY